MQTKIKLYSFYSPSHERIKDEWFLKTLKDDYEIDIRRCEQKGSGRYRTKGWAETILFREDMVIEAIKENWGRIFVYSDIDVQFFKKTEPILVDAINNFDIVLQKDDPQNNACLGFFVARANKETLNFFDLLRKRVLKEGRDQVLANRILKDYNLAGVISFKNIIKGLFKGLLNRFNYGLLPDVFFSGGTFSGKIWQPGMDLSIPKDIVLHHANWTVGVDNKILQLKYVKEKSENESTNCLL
ncbi:MAG: hypothetical protein JW867_04115 [Candidatus Omnitrophica bacterium]|nr:hypothetical protein [Candidatus Omnitrophota bacterium]